MYSVIHRSPHTTPPRIALLLCALYGILLPLGQSSEKPETPFIKNIRRLTFVGAKNGEAYFSPDGKRIVFQGVREPLLKNPFYQIYAMDLAGGTVSRVSKGLGRTTCSYVHPKKPRMIFASSRLDPNAKQHQAKEFEQLKKKTHQRYAWNFDPKMDIFETDLDGSNSIRLTQAEGYDAECGYSPDGQQIVFCSFRDGDGEIYVMDAYGKNQRRLTHVKGYDGGPFFSPDGKSIVWRRFSLDDKAAEVWLMNADGSNQRVLTKIGAMAWAPFFHPSGLWIAFACNHEDAAFEVYAIKTDGSQTIRLTRSEGFDGLPVFSPDGRQLMWTSNRDGDGSHVYIADVQLPGIPNESKQKSPPPHQAIKAKGLATKAQSILKLYADQPSSALDVSQYLAGAFLAQGLSPCKPLPEASTPKKNDFIFRSLKKGPLRTAGACCPQGLDWQKTIQDDQLRFTLLWTRIPPTKQKDPNALDVSNLALLLELSQQMQGVAQFRGLKHPFLMIALESNLQTEDSKKIPKALLDGILDKKRIAHAVFLDLKRTPDLSCKFFAAGSVQGWRMLAEILAAANPTVRIHLKDERNEKHRSESLHGTLVQAFSNEKIPCLAFHKDPSPIQTSKEAPTKNEDRALQDMANLVLGAVYRLTTGSVSPTYGIKDLLEAATRRRLYLGTRPEYKGDGKGVVLRGIYQNSPAQKAGLLAGDKIIELGGKKVGDVEAYLQALQQLEAEKKTSIKIIRAGKMLTLSIRPQLR